MLPLTEADQQALLRWAREALEQSIRDHGLKEIPAPPGVLSEPCGAFVTLHKAGRLRGCIGYVEPLKPLYVTVRECAMAAALQDPRFDPVSSEEIPALHLEISVLSPLEDVLPEHIEVGRHGLLISRGRQRGLLLPQVAVEYAWDRQRFLEETSMKAGLPPDAWRHGARIQAFTAQILEEPSGRARSSKTSAA
jgi:AmmeMemoRadiSam system protein A